MLYKKGTVFYQGTWQKLDVRAEGERITEVQPELLPRPYEQVYDLTGELLLPGFIDLHTHGREGVDFSYGEVEDILAVQKKYSKQGVTSILATTMSLSETQSIAMLERLGEAIEKHGEGCRILGIHLEGPALGLSKKGCHKAEFLRAPQVEWLKAWDKVAQGHIKMISIDPTYPEALATIAALTPEKVFSLAHTEATYAQVHQSIKAGARHVTHLFNAMRPLHHREPGLIGAAFDAPLSVELIADGLHVHPVVMAMAFQLFGEKLCLVSDSCAAAGYPEGEYVLGDLPIWVREGAGHLEDGTLACSTISLFDGFRRSLALGIASETVIAACTSQPAAVLGLENSIGSIAAGYWADLLVLDQGYNLKRVFVGGKEQDR